MNQQINLKDIEKKIYQSTFQDGLIEIFISAVTLMFAISPLLSADLGDFWASFIFLPFWGVVFLCVRIIRNQIVIPRIGSVEFSKWRKKRLKKFLLLMVIFNLAALILGIVSFVGFDKLTAWTVPFRFSGIILVGFSLASVLVQQPRFSFYGVLLAAAPIIGEYLYQNFGAEHHGYPISFGFSAAVLFGVGLFMLLHLVVSHPLETYTHPDEEEK